MASLWRTAENLIEEEKDFIRKNLQQGLNIKQVIARVEQEYGHRI
jgi:hypothetical protein